MKRWLLLTLATLTLATPAVAGRNPDYVDTIRRTAAMVSDPEAQARAQKHGLQILNVTWEDTGRYKGSSVGPNISDMTLQIQRQDPRTQQYELTCLPVVRFPNFEDRTADLALDDFFLLVGNEDGEGLRRVTLRKYLGDLRAYMSDPGSWKGDRESLLAKRDDDVLVSAQACFLPIPQQGKAEFNPVLFNYQSYEGDPAVLTILATREGTSMTVIDNKRDGFAAGATWGQRLFFNHDGQRASFTGERLSDFRASGGDPGGKTPTAAGQEGLNMVLLIQVPLKQKNEMRLQECDDALAVPCASGGYAKSERARSDVENAVIGHGKVEGPFTEIAGLDIQRDERFPIRVTVQFYKATSNGVVSDKDMAEIAGQIEKVYANAKYVGSLVTEGETGRPTEYSNAPKTEPAGWWNSFWQRHESNTGQDREDALDMLWHLLKMDERS